MERDQGNEHESLDIRRSMDWTLNQNHIDNFSDILENDSNNITESNYFESDYKSAEEKDSLRAIFKESVTMPDN